MKRDVQLLLLIGMTLFLLSACTQQASVETSTQDTAEETSSSIDSTNEEISTDSETTQEDTTSSPEGSTSENIITITSSGFSPSTLTVAQGTTVTFVNEDSSAHRPASNPHPSHTGYPEEGTCSGSAFDSCTNLAEGESWSFTFNQIGEWGYHDHLNSGLSGTIIVE